MLRHLDVRIPPKIQRKMRFLKSRMTPTLFSVIPQSQMVKRMASWLVLPARPQNPRQQGNHRVGPFREVPKLLRNPPQRLRSQFRFPPKSAQKQILRAVILKLQQMKIGDGELFCCLFLVMITHNSRRLHVFNCAENFLCWPSRSRARNQTDPWLWLVDLRAQMIQRQNQW